MTQLSFPDRVAPADARTQGIKYIGSKLKLLPYILQLARTVDAVTVLDGFAGTTRVSQAFARNGYSVICNDAAVWSSVFGTAYLTSSGSRADYEPLIDHLNGVEPIDGWFTEHYGGQPNSGCSVQGDGLKRPWQVHNTRKLDAIREEITRLRLAPSTEAVALTSLVLALDKVDSTLGHFASYLREWSPRSYGELVLQVPEIVESDGAHSVIRADIFETLKDVAADLVYFDPPYGSNNEKMPPSRVRYASYYHLWTTVCLADRPGLFGKARRRDDAGDRIAASVFEDFRKNAEGQFIALAAIDKLMSVANARWVILSYSSGGRATASELNEVIHKNGTVLDVMEIDLKRNVMASMCWTNEWLREVRAPNREFLFLVEKG
jgi:adenine-specific DNA-methyltransferase